MGDLCHCPFSSGSGHSRAAAHMDSHDTAVYIRPVQAEASSNPNTERGAGHEVPPLAEGVLAIKTFLI